MSRRIVKHADCAACVISLLCPGKLVPNFLDRCRGYADCPAVCMGHLSRHIQVVPKIANRCRGCRRNVRLLTLITSTPLLIPSINKGFFQNPDLC